VDKTIVAASNEKQGIGRRALYFYKDPAPHSRTKRWEIIIIEIMIITLNGKNFF